jgi:hypothetical protein
MSTQMVTRWMRRRILALTGKAGLLGAFGRSGLAQATKPPDLYFYPPPLRVLPDSLLASPLTFETSQITSLFPQIAEMAGVVLLIYWREISLGPSSYDLSIVENALRFWEAAGKRVVLGIPSVGFPVRRSFGQAPFGATPDWVLRRVSTYVQASRLIGPINMHDPGRTTVVERIESFVFPSYWDPYFLEAVNTLVKQIARYDGHPALAAVRVSTGILGEDNPTFDGLRSEMPGFSATNWLKYCGAVLGIYLANFRRTPLEFDISRVGWIFARGRDGNSGLADKFVSSLLANNVLIAFAGTDVDAVLSWRSGKSSTLGPARDLEYIAAAHRSGHPIGLEGAPLWNPRLQDIQTLSRAIIDLQPQQLVLFSDVAGLLNYTRRGLNETNSMVIEEIPPGRRDDLTHRAAQLLNQIGYS